MAKTTPSAPQKLRKWLGLRHSSVRWRRIWSASVNLAASHASALVPPPAPRPLPGLAAVRSSQLERWFSSCGRPPQLDLARSGAPGLTARQLLSLAAPGDVEAYLDIPLDYGPGMGTERLRSAVASVAGCSLDDVVVTHGAIEALLLSCAASLEKRTAVAVAAPGYEGLFRAVEAVGGVVQAVPVWNPGASALDLGPLLDLDLPRYGAVIVNSPHNPTGLTAPAGDLVDLADRCAAAGTTLIVDQVSVGTLDPGAHSVLRQAPGSSAVVQVGDVSKAFGLGGLRVGWCAVPQPARRARIAELRDVTSLANSAPSQHLAAIALENRDASVGGTDGPIEPRAPVRARGGRHTGHMEHAGRRARRLPGLSAPSLCPRVRRPTARTVRCGRHPGVVLRLRPPPPRRAGPRSGAFRGGARPAGRRAGSRGWRMTPEAREPAPAAGDQAPPDLPRHRRTSERLRQAAAYPPPGPFRARWWRSPVRGPWLTSYFGSILLVGIPLMFLTGLVSYASYNPRLAGNDTTPGKGILGFYLFSWVTSPSWVYRVSQGTHVILGLTLVPIVLAKLWSVIPKLFEWPGVRSVAHGLERLSLMLVVGGALFEFATGIADIEYYYPWKFDFYEAHLYGVWVFIVGFVVHVCLKLPTMWRSLQRYSLREIFTTPLACTRPEPGDGHGLVASHPSPPTISRRGVLGLAGGSAAAVFLLTAGGTVRVLRPLALLSPWARSQGTGPHPEANDFEVNRACSQRRASRSPKRARAGASSSAVHAPCRCRVPI